MVYFPDPADDPRLSPRETSYPIRYRDVKLLSKEQFHFGLQQNRLNRAQGQDPYMIGTRRMPDQNGAQIFSNNGAMKGLQAEAEATIRQESDTGIRYQVPREKRELVVRLP